MRNRHLDGLTDSLLPTRRRDAAPAGHPFYGNQHGGGGEAPTHELEGMSASQREVVSQAHEKAMAYSKRMATEKLTSRGAHSAAASLHSAAGSLASKFGAPKLAEFHSKAEFNHTRSAYSRHDSAPPGHEFNTTSEDTTMRQRHLDGLPNSLLPTRKDSAPEGHPFYGNQHQGGSGGEGTGRNGERAGGTMSALREAKETHAIALHQLSLKEAAAKANPSDKQAQKEHEQAKSKAERAHAKVRRETEKAVNKSTAATKKSYEKSGSVRSRMTKQLKALYG